MQKSKQRKHGGQRTQYVGEVGTDEVRDQELDR